MTEIRYLSGIEGREGREEKRKKRKERVKKVSRVAKKIYLSGLRNSFLTLLRINFLGLASNLAANELALKKLQNIWQRLGGSRRVLLKIIENSKNKKPLINKRILNFVKDAVKKFKSGNLKISKIGEISGEPMTLAALITSSIPLIIKTIDLVAEKKKNEESFESDED